MKTLSIIFGILFSLLVIYLTLDFLDNKYELDLKRKGKILCNLEMIAVMMIDIAAVSLFGVFRYGNEFWGRYYLMILLMIAMSVLSVTDYKKNVIPNIVITVSIAAWVLVCGLSIIFEMEEGMKLTGSSLAGGLLAGISFLLCYFLSKRKLGGGDVKMAIVVGLFLGGDYIVFALFVGIALCAVCSLILMLLKKMTVKDTVPLAPFMFLGVAVTLLI